METSSVASNGYPRSSASPAYFDISHRRDIDGLRALAALSVVAVHTVHKTIPGGGSGVDMFFVLSGFLISGIILRALVACNN
jgi:peptidoglycan/LPS O-acetylase OafA/YrhL